ncbi:MAG: tRNA-dihydrouridine synthase family protein, partial [Anaerolineales bacterium]|nr:tRNA-dihydrouridine synthase family protein [Anaerolineales bacterium]
MITPTFYVLGIPIYGDTILSPMEGYSDQPYRRLCCQMGSAMSYTEFINARDILEGNPHVSRKFIYNQEERPVVFQIYGDNAIALLEVALRLQEYGPDIIDVNIGCPSRAVSGHGAGAGLLRTPVKIARIIRKLSRLLSVPLTAKMRLGWDDASRNYLLVARIIEENGGAMIAVHGRTKRQGYAGPVDLDAIAEIRQALSIPVVANGDIQNVADIDHMLAYTGCPAVMIG